MKRIGMVLGAFALLLVTSQSAQALAIVGELNITGSVRVSAAAIDWIPYSPSGGGSGVFSTVDPGTGYFTGIVNPAVNPAYIGSATDLVGQVLPITNFMNSFKEQPVDLVSEYDDLSFTLSTIVAPTAVACTGAEAVNISCSFGVFTLKNTSTGVDIGFGVLGHWVDLTYGDDGTLNNTTGNYTTQLVGKSVQYVLAEINGGRLITTSYSGNFISTDATVPEPATMLTFGLGMLALGTVRRRRANKTQA